jgi:hypothetical protein
MHSKWSLVGLGIAPALVTWATNLSFFWSYSIGATFWLFSYFRDKRVVELDNLPLDHRATWEKPRRPTSSLANDHCDGPGETLTSHTFRSPLPRSVAAEPSQPRIDLVPCPRCVERHTVEAALLEARRLIAFWGAQAPERTKKESDLAGDLARIDAVMKKSGV